MTPDNAHLPVQAMWWIPGSVSSVSFKYIKSEMELILFTLISGHRGANGKEREAAATSSTARNPHLAHFTSAFSAQNCSPKQTNTFQTGAQGPRSSPTSCDGPVHPGDVALLPVWVWPWLGERHPPPGPWSCSIHTQRNLHLWSTERGGAWVGAGDRGLKTRRRTLVHKRQTVLTESSLLTEEEGDGWTGEQGEVVGRQEKVQTDSPVFRLRFCLQLTEETLKTNTFVLLEAWRFFVKHKTIWCNMIGRLYDVMKAFNTRFICALQHN